jgi:hypothetical protein
MHTTPICSVYCIRGRRNGRMRRGSRVATWAGRCDGGRAQHAAASLSLSLSLSLSYKRDEAAGGTRDAQRTGVSGGFECSVFEERLRHGALSSGRRVRSWVGLVWSQTQGLVVLGVSVA